MRKMLVALLLVLALTLSLGQEKALADCSNEINGCSNRCLSIVRKPLYDSWLGWWYDRKKNEG
jgi:hypothetical protein